MENYHHQHCSLTRIVSNNELNKVPNATKFMNFSMMNFAFPAENKLALSNHVASTIKKKKLLLCSTASKIILFIKMFGRGRLFVF